MAYLKMIFFFSTKIQDSQVYKICIFISGYSGSFFESVEEASRAELENGDEASKSPGARL